MAKQQKSPDETPSAPHELPAAGAYDATNGQKPPIALQRRALTLLEMLRRAAADEGYVMWQPD